MQTEIELKKLQLLPVKNPAEVQAASSQVTDEIYKLMRNLQILEEIKLMLSVEIAEYKYHLSAKRLNLESQVTKEYMQEKGIGANSKMKYIELLSAAEEKEFDICKANFNYYANISEVYREWLMAYKKTIQFDKM